MSEEEEERTAGTIAHDIVNKLLDVLARHGILIEDLSIEEELWGVILDAMGASEE